MPPYPLADPSLSYDETAALHQFARRSSDPFVPNDTQKVTLGVAAGYILAIAILWHVPILEWIIYPFKLLTVGMHELSHAIAGILTCASVEQITLDPHEGGSTRMRGGIPAITLPAGYLGSSFIGASLVTCGFNTNASKVASLVLIFLFILTLWWAKRSWVAWFSIAITVALIVITWLVAHSVALRFVVLFLGVMSCFYSIWDIVDDSLARKVNTSDASEYAAMIGCCSSRFWGAFWLIQACCFFIAGILIGLVAFKQDWAQQRADADHFLGGSP